MFLRTCWEEFCFQICCVCLTSPPPLSFLLLKAQKDLCVCETFQVEEWKSLHCAYPCLEAEINSDGLRAELFSILRYLLTSELCDWWKMKLKQVAVCERPQTWLSTGSASCAADIDGICSLLKNNNRKPEHCGLPQWSLKSVINAALPLSHA